MYEYAREGGNYSQMQDQDSAIAVASGDALTSSYGLLQGWSAAQISAEA